MLKTLLKSKLHRINVTQVELDYEGSCAVDQDFLNTAGMAEYEKVDVLNGAFEAHSLILEGYSEEAEELLKKVIPKIQKKVLVIELEYLLALAYANQGKTDDCKAVCEFISERNRQVVHTILCKELLDTIS